MCSPKPAHIRKPPKELSTALSFPPLSFHSVAAETFSPTSQSALQISRTATKPSWPERVVMRSRLFRLFFTATATIVFLYTLLRLSPPVRAGNYKSIAFELTISGSAQAGGLESPSQTTAAKSQSQEYEPVSSSLQSHPILELIRRAERDPQLAKSRQSKTLQEAVREYRRRYGIHPPPNFDKWYNYAKSRNVVLIDEFDTVHEVLTPFWGLKPETTRGRVAEALGYGNSLFGVSIRGHNITHASGGGKKWQQAATLDMLNKFVQYLPDMDLAFNVNDEPRVVLQHDDLTRLVEQAAEVNMPAAASTRKPRNSFTKTQKGWGTGQSFEETRTTRFNAFPHQNTWASSRMSCPPDSPARQLEDNEAADALSTYCLSDPCFISNVTAFSDVCLTPSLRTSYGFFDMPNAYSVTHDLIPIFSQSKLSSYSDILYPSPWYWAEKVPYDETDDPDWTQKESKLYWRGSTTGGYSRWGAWRRHHRQNAVRKLNSLDETKVLINQGSESTPQWTVHSTHRGNYPNLLDVAFSHIGQCDAGDCIAQRNFFNVTALVEQEQAWGYKFLLDMDGNAFSGRFHAFLRSKSLTFKFALFREWHMDWLMPWAHYVPLSLKGDEWLEAVRFFHEDPVGRGEAERLARQSTEWAGKTLRKEDLEAWFFRLLLEYGRVVDDDRDKIGFSI